jgi:hypothetical protein
MIAHNLRTGRLARLIMAPTLLFGIICAVFMVWQSTAAAIVPSDASMSAYDRAGGAESDRFAVAVDTNMSIYDLAGGVGGTDGDHRFTRSDEAGDTGSVKASGAGDARDVSVKVTETGGVIKDSIPFTLAYLPISSWSEITPERYPNLHRIIEGAATGNLVSDDATISQQLSERSTIYQYNLEGMGAREADAMIGSLVPNSLQQGVLVLVSSSSFVREGRPTALTPVVVVDGGGLSGLLTSSTTQRSGLITASDILYFERQLNADEDSVVTTPTQAQTKTEFDLTGVPTSAPLKDRLAFLQHNIDICQGIDATNEAMNLVLLALFLLTAACSLVLLFLEINVNPRYLSVLVPVNRGLLLVMLSFPIACFLMFLVPPPLYAITDTPAGLITSCLLWTTLLVVAALLIGSLSRWVYSLLFLFVITFGVLLADQLLGGPLSLTGYLNYGVNSGIRYYGLGNEAAALLFGSWITFSGLVVNRFASAKLIPAFKQWLFLLLSALIILICALPGVGASFGVLVWGVMGVLITWWLLGGRAITLRFLLVSIALCLLLAVSTLIVDVNFNPYSHMGNVASVMPEGPLAVLAQLVSGVVGYSWQTLTYSPALTATFILVIVWLVVLAAVKPGTYHEFWARNLGFRAAYAAGLTVVLIMCFIEDSGIYMPALYIVYLLAGFIWLVCDMHTWRARTSLASGQHISIRELLAMTIERETYEQLGQGKNIASYYLDDTDTNGSEGNSTGESNTEDTGGNTDALADEYIHSVGDRSAATHGGNSGGSGNDSADGGNSSNADEDGVDQ